MLVISILFGILLIYILSETIFEKVSYVNWLLTLFIISSPIQLLTYTQAWIIKYYLFGISSLSLFLLFYKIFKKEFSWHKTLYLKINPIKESSLSNFKAFKIYDNFIQILVTFILTYKFLPFIWRFEAHDLVYYSWLNGILNLDYFGTLKVPTAYPFELAANHLMAGSILTPFSMFINPINMYDIFSIKYLIVFSSFFYFIRSFFKKFLQDSKNDLSKVLISICLIFLTFFTYSTEIDYSISISSYLIIILILTLTGFVLELSLDEENLKFKNNSKIIDISFFFLFALLISKATTFPVFSLTCFFFFVSLGKKRTLNIFQGLNKLKIFLILGLIIISLLAWTIPESTHGSVAFSLPICLSDFDNTSNLIKCAKSILSNPFDGWYVPGIKYSFLGFFEITKNVTLFLYVWLVCLIPCFLSSRYIINTSKYITYKFFAKFSFFYALSASITTILFRDSLKFSGSFAAHSYLLAVIFTTSCITLILIEKTPNIFSQKKLNIFIIMFIFLLIILNYFDGSIIARRHDAILGSKIKAEDRISLTFMEMNKFDDNSCTSDKKIISRFGKYLDSNGCGGPDIGEIRAALIGERTNISLNSNSSIIREFSIDPKSK